MLKISQLITYHNTILDFKDDMITHSVVAFNYLVFIPLDGNSSVIMPFESISRLAETKFPPARIRYDRDSRIYSIFLVKFKCLNDNHINIMDYKSFKYWCASPIDPKHGWGNMSSLREQAKEWEVFRLHRICEISETMLAPVIEIFSNMLRESPPPPRRF